MKKLKFTVHFLYRLSLFWSQLHYGDAIYRFACPTTLAKLDRIYHAALMYRTGSHFMTHHCTLYIPLLDLPHTVIEEWSIYQSKAYQTYIYSFIVVVSINCSSQKKIKIHTQCFPKKCMWLVKFASTNHKGKQSIFTFKILSWTSFLRQIN